MLDYWLLACVAGDKRQFDEVDLFGHWPVADVGKSGDVVSVPRRVALHVTFRWNQWDRRRLAADECADTFEGENLFG